MVAVVIPDINHAIGAGGSGSYRIFTGRRAKGWYRHLTHIQAPVEQPTRIREVELGGKGNRTTRVVIPGHDNVLPTDKLTGRTSDSLIIVACIITRHNGGPTGPDVAIVGVRILNDGRPASQTGGGGLARGTKVH